MFNFLPNRQDLIEEHTEMLAIRKKGITLFWKKRYDAKNRDTLRWEIEQAKFHKHMIAQIESLPDFGLAF